MSKEIKSEGTPVCPYCDHEQERLATDDPPAEGEDTMQCQYCDDWFWCEVIVSFKTSGSAKEEPIKKNPPRKEKAKR